MRKQIATLFLTVMLTGCAGLTGLSANAELFAACFSYDRTLSVLNTFRISMSPAQVTRVKSVVAVVSPICKKKSSSTVTLTSIQAVRDGLRRLARIEVEMKK